MNNFTQDNLPWSNRTTTKPDSTMKADLNPNLLVVVDNKGSKKRVKDLTVQDFMFILFARTDHCS